MDTMQKNPSSMIHHPAVKLVISLVVLIIVVVLAIWLYKKYVPVQNNNPRELTPAQKEEIINNLVQQQADAPKLTPVQQKEVVKQLEEMSKQSPSVEYTDAQKQEILNNLQQQR
jgi:Tfp pilus assembly protein PilO